MQHLAWRGLLDRGLKFRPMTLPDRLIEHDTPMKQYEEAGLNAAQIVRVAMTALGDETSADDKRSSSHESLRVRTS